MGVEQHLGIGGIIFAKATHKVVVGRTQREEPVAGVHHPLDEGLDSGQGLAVGPSGEPAFAKVVANEAQPVLGQFAGQFTVEGRGRGARGRLFQSSWWSTLQNFCLPERRLDSRLLPPPGAGGTPALLLVSRRLGAGSDGWAGKFQKRGHLRTFQDIRTWQPALEEAWMSGLGGDRSSLSAFFGHKSPYCLSGFSGLVLVRWGVVLHRYYGREVFYHVASGGCQWDKFPGSGFAKVYIKQESWRKFYAD